MTQAMKRDRRNYTIISLLMFPPLFVAGVVTRLRSDDKAKRSIVREAAADARSAIEIALTDA